MGIVLEEPAHLYRLMAWSLISLTAGLLFLVRNLGSGFGAMTSTWALVNYATVFLAVRTPLVSSIEEFRRSLLLHLGLNLVAAVVGFVMMRRRGSAWISPAGLAMLQQAAVLGVLNLYLYGRTSR